MALLWVAAVQTSQWNFGVMVSHPLMLWLAVAAAAAPQEREEAPLLFTRAHD